MNQLVSMRSHSSKSPLIAPSSDHSESVSYQTENASWILLEEGLFYQEDDHYRFLCYGHFRKIELEGFDPITNTLHYCRLILQDGSSLLLRQAVNTPSTGKTAIYFLQALFQKMAHCHSPCQLYTHPKKAFPFMAFLIGTSSLMLLYAGLSFVIDFPDLTPFFLMILLLFNGLLVLMYFFNRWNKPSITLQEGLNIFKSAARATL